MRIKDLRNLVKPKQFVIISDETGDVYFRGYLYNLTETYLLEMYVIWIEPLHNNINGNILGVII